MLVLLHQLHWVHIRLRICRPTMLDHVLVETVRSSLLLVFKQSLQLLDSLLKLSFFSLELDLLYEFIIYLLFGLSCNFSHLLALITNSIFLLWNLFRLPRSRVCLYSAVLRFRTGF